MRKARRVAVYAACLCFARFAPATAEREMMRCMHATDDRRHGSNSSTPLSLSISLSFILHGAHIFVVGFLVPHRETVVLGVQ